MSATPLKWITGGMEAVLGIPFIGGAIVLGNAWTPLGIMAVLHVITLLLAIRSGQAKAGSILGIITSMIGWIPFVGMTLHIVTAIVLVVDAARGR
ncbi:MAG TPA: hypothetical protein VEY51_21705 [Chondromyces sp.]|nr:hypothetical protein [Chondromyces sp.]